MGKKRGGVLFRLLLVGLIAYIVISFVQLQVELNAKRLELASLQAAVQQQSLKNEELQGVLDMRQDDEYIERMAREKLDYAYPDEQVFLDISGS